MDIQSWDFLKMKRVGLQKLLHHLTPSEDINSNLQFLVSITCTRNRVQNRTHNEKLMFRNMLPKNTITKHIKSILKCTLPINIYTKILTFSVFAFCSWKNMCEQVVCFQSLPLSCQVELLISNIRC